MLEVSGLVRVFGVTVSSKRGPARQAGSRRVPGGGRRLASRPSGVLHVFEDSENGIRSAKSAGMRVLAIPNPQYLPAADALALADLALDSIAELTETVDRGL